MTFGSVCSGIEAASVAWHPLGWQTAWLAEIDRAPAAVLAHHYPTTWNLGDLTAIAPLIRAGVLPAPEVLVGGTPCQAFSMAGLRRSLDDARGQLSLAFVDLANAIDEQRDAPAVIVWENVPGVLSTKDNAFGCFLAALAGEDEALVAPGGKWPNAGCVYGPQRTVAWRILDAQYFGVAQRRRRVFVIASARDDIDPATILFESTGMRRDSAPSREAGAIVAPLLANGSGISGADVSHGQAGHLMATAIRTANTSSNGWGISEGGPTYTLDAAGGGQCVAVCITGDITHTLKAEGFDGSEDGTGRGQPIVTVTLRGRDGGGTAELGGEVAGCLRASSGGGDKPHALVQSAVRRLTPTECERLQGFRDGHTLVPYRGKLMADGPRYKMLGNSMAVPCMAWLGKRIDAALRRAHNAPE